MARPQKPRLVADDAPATYFKPQGIPLYELTEITLTLDGFEAIRHVDGEGLDQVEAAALMGVSRSTLSRILAQARRTVATALSRGLALRIEGGNVRRAQARDCGHRPQASLDVAAVEEAAMPEPEGTALPDQTQDT